MHEIMTIEEVAAYIRVSERTVYDWAQKSELPGGKLGTTWRFKRADIEKWVNDRLSKEAAVKSGSKKAATASFVLTRERVVLLDHPSKKEVLTQLVDLLAETPFVKNRDALLKGILEREELMSTGIGFGIGVPHVRIDSVTDLVMAVAVSKNPVTDYTSLDEAPVQIICMLAARTDQHTKYIRTLSAISSRLKDPDVRREIIASNDPAAICKLLIDSEQ
ncbi:PTS sugar transporter subunit IIA [Pontiella sulfatireligans]|uniref:PTS system fructose-specific EIIABC component n=1 Tax=Pontiella sulfatireligans TaxID=2750658 RepID=A0A6C2UL55_9BACT|nr:PTS sugar transporter subunit IIA [Pontiella sulfatireligans]VGO20623.1 PTS system fructose-specific EIIABC component [Pontiella sulfatireligans]